MPDALARLLERESHSVHLPDDAYDGLLRRRERQERNRRVVTIIVALAVVALSIAGLTSALLDRSAPTPADTTITSENVSSLQLAWSAPLGDVAPTPAISDGVVADATESGLIRAFREDCATNGATCQPLWTAALNGAIPVTTDAFDPITWWPGAADQPNAGYRHGSLTAADGRFYALDRMNRLYAFDAACRDDGGSCPPVWTSSALNSVKPHPEDSSLPMVDGGHVYVVDTSGIYAFDVNCKTHQGTCTPLWHVAVSGVLRVQDGHLYVTDTTFGTAMELDPATGTKIWSGGPGGRCCGNTPAPVLLDGRIYVNFGDELWAFPTTCHGACDPEWTTPIPDRFSDGPLLAGDVLVLSTAQDQSVGGMWFIPLSCARAGASCASQAWRRPQVFAELTTHQPVAAGTTVFAVSRRGGGLFVFDASCTAATTCQPVRYDATILEPTTPVVAGDVVFVSGGAIAGLRAYPAQCGASCKPVWTDSSFTPAEPVAVDGSHVFSVDTSGVLRAFAPGAAAPAGAVPATAHSPGLAPLFYLGGALLVTVIWLVRRRRVRP